MRHVRGHGCCENSISRQKCIAVSKFTKQKDVPQARIGLHCNIAQYLQCYRTYQAQPSPLMLAAMKEQPDWQIDL
jgi:hypothetical protein